MLHDLVCGLVLEQDGMRYPIQGMCEYLQLTMQAGDAETAYARLTARFIADDPAWRIQVGDTLHCGTDFHGLITEYEDLSGMGGACPRCSVVALDRSCLMRVRCREA